MYLVIKDGLLCMKTFLKLSLQFFAFSLLNVCVLQEPLLSAVSTEGEKEAKRLRPSVGMPDDLVWQREDLRGSSSSLWKESLNFSYLPSSRALMVDGWHQMNGAVMPALQRELASLSKKSDINIAIAGLQCIYREGGDTSVVTTIVNLPKLFVSGYKANFFKGFDYTTFVDKVFGSPIPEPIEPAVRVLKTYTGLYGIGDGYVYTAFDEGYPHLRAYMEQNFNLWLGESSLLSSTYLQSKLDIIRRGGEHSGLFDQNYFHSEQAILAYLESEEGMDFLLHHLFGRLSEERGKPQIVQLVLHISSYYDVCDSCADTLFRESEVGRMFLKKLEGRLKARYYLYPHINLLLLVETSGILPYRGAARSSTRPADFESQPFFKTPLVATQASPFIMRMKIGERR